MESKESTRINNAVRQILEALEGTDLREGIVDTPDRVARAYAEMFWGYNVPSGEFTAKMRRHFEVGNYEQLVVLDNIEFYTFCEHHMLPFYGTATVGYLPQPGKAIGLSKIPRIVEYCAARLQVQERLTTEIATILGDVTDSDSIAVVVAAKHLCMCARGVKSRNANTHTSYMGGKFRTEASLRSEFLQIARRS